jgi:magnesium transporter
MLRAYGPGCDGSVVEASLERIPDEATWIDLEEPTKEEEALVERCIHVNVPTEAEMAEIEPSSRLFERNGALYMTVSVLCGVIDGTPTTTPISFVLADNRLVTVRYAKPKPIRAFEDHVRREPELARDAGTVLVRMLDAIIDRLADEIENQISEIEKVSRTSFNVRWMIAGFRGASDGAPDANWRTEPADENALLGCEHNSHAELPVRIKLGP